MTVTPLRLDALVASALAAGRAVMEVYDGDIAVSVKSDASPVTLADERAEALILADLAEILPGVPVVAEEQVSGGHIPAALGNRFVLVDPLDGTKEFVSRNGEFTVNIALVEVGRPVVGVVLAPALGEIYVGVVGEGARLGRIGADGTIAWAPITVRPTPAAGWSVLASRSHAGPETEALLARLPIAERVSAGSSLKFCRLAAGVADFYPRLGRTMEWDTAAGDAVLTAAGGVVTTLDGAPLAYGKRRQAHDSDFANSWFLASASCAIMAASVKEAPAVAAS